MKVQSYEKGSSYAGLTYEEWTVEWWRWALSIPHAKNPVVDQSGEYADESQPVNVWFLAGIFAEENERKSFPSRKCTISSGVPVLIPILNCAADDIHYPELKNDQALIEHVSRQVGRVEKKECTVNDEIIEPEIVSSYPRVFDLYIHPDFDTFHKGGNSRASAEGYWVFLKPLPIGRHIIQFQGAYENGALRSGAMYTINII
jgi:hypothetical protein